MSRVVSLAEAVAGIPDGALLTFGGFDLNRAPMALVRELVRQKKQGLRVVSPPNPLPLDFLVGAGAAVEAEFGYIGFQYEHGFVVAPNVRTAIEAGSLRWRERDVFEIVQGLRASATGVPFLPAPGGDDSDYARVNPTPRMPLAPGSPPLPVVPAIRPDVALIHAQQGDPDGNLFISDPYADDLLARASRRLVATVEEMVPRVGQPGAVGVRAEALALAPGGAFPTACHRRYRHAPAHLRSYFGQVGEGRFGDYLATLLGARDGEAGFIREAGGLPLWNDEASSDGTRAGADKDRSADGTAPAAADRLVCGLARRIADGDLVVTGLASALPMLAVAVARATHAPGLTYVNCVGAVDPDIEAIGATSVDARLLDRCRGRVILTDLFDLARNSRIDVMFFGAAQVDAAARLNLTCIGDFLRPRVKLPGPAGSTSIRTFVRKVVVLVPRHSTRALVERVDFASSTASLQNRETWVVSDLAVLRLDAGRLKTASVHAGVSADEVRAMTGFALETSATAPDPTTPEPTREEMAALARFDPGGLRHRLIRGG